MQRDQIIWAKALTLLGAIPFVAAVLAQIAGMAHYHTAYLSLTYGAIIISFLSGIHWGLYITHAKAKRINLLVSSNILALLAWLSLLLLVPVTQYLIQITCFISLLLIDRQLAADGAIEAWFYQLRLQISSLVIICLLLLVWLQH
ncbi:DUF3429 domain-containing protein [Methylophilus medardicus]|uniref:DUF3429 domain-containing protein n=1 Tax=Methylophilus medardicus TaxID=2588534 RepID=A0A5B8CPT7_9PROT|nr:DUF3429 domain-containing protein [Methylophilus medardicus]QDC43242.1 DUF3429 domain-containing protein [Methylophilus medardicus]QDC48249.1 DUF3429 domain-containing protein [Methylophilus medardicus]QDC51954.1 DUF3429 domain-containing protein [Methylophilus medardicus]